MISDFRVKNLKKKIKQINNEIQFAQFIKKNYRTHKVIYTDASVNPENKTCGIGIYCLQPEIQISRRITDYTPICTAETLAIIEAIRAMGHQTNQLLIVTGIEGNEKADALAFRGRLNENVTQANLLNYETFFPQIKKHLWEI